MITASLGVLLLPWKLVQSPSGFIFSWLIGYSALLGPIAGVMCVEYLASRFEISEPSLYTKDPRGAYFYSGGYSRPAFVSLAVGTLINIPGFLAQVRARRRGPRAERPRRSARR